MDNNTIERKLSGLTEIKSAGVVKPSFLKASLSAAKKVYGPPEESKFDIVSGTAVDNWMASAIKLKEVSLLTNCKRFCLGGVSTFCKASNTPLVAVASELYNSKPLIKVLFESPVTKTESPSAMISFSSDLPINDSKLSAVPA